MKSLDLAQENQAVPENTCYYNFQSMKRIALIDKSILNVNPTQPNGLSNKKNVD